MNLREGRIGRQETAALALTGCTAAGLFAGNPAVSSAGGNSAYISSALSAALALLLFLLLGEAMARKNCSTLAGLYRFSFGGLLAGPMALVTFLALLLSAVAPLGQLFDILDRFVFPNASPVNLMLYLLPCVLYLALAGLETAGRATRLLLPVFLLGVLIALLTAIPAYEGNRLYPLLGNGLKSTLLLGVMGVGRFFSPMLCLLICGVGVQGLSNAAAGASIGALGGGVLTGGAQLCLGMAYPYELLQKLPSPMYRLTMSVRTGSAYQRLDKLLLFFWIMGGVLSAGFHAYGAALLYASSVNMKDVRPAAGASAVCLCVLVLLGQMEPELTAGIAARIRGLLPFALLLPPLLAAALACLKKGAAK